SASDASAGWTSPQLSASSNDTSRVGSGQRSPRGFLVEPARYERVVPIRLPTPYVTATARAPTTTWRRPERRAARPLRTPMPVPRATRARGAATSAATTAAVRQPIRYGSTTTNAPAANAIMLDAAAVQGLP